MCRLLQGTPKVAQMQVWVALEQETFLGLSGPGPKRLLAPALVDVGGNPGIRDSCSSSGGGGNIGKLWCRWGLGGNCSIFFLSVFFAFLCFGSFSSPFPPHTVQEQMTAICLDNWEFHADPIYTDPVRDFWIIAL